MQLVKPSQPRVAMIQDGARRRYLVPIGLQGAGILERAYIDWFVRRGSAQEAISRLVARLNPHLGQKMLDRSSAELDPKLVVSNAAMTLRVRMKTPHFTRSEESYMWASRQTAKWVLRRGFGNANCLYGFIRNAAPEVYRAARAQGLRTSGDQIIAPLEVEVAEMKRQVARWPGWNDREALEMYPKYLEFERETWESLDRITCMSEYVREGLESVGVNKDKIEVIPYPWIEAPGSYVPRQKKSGPLIVGFVGHVCLRKGAPWFLEVARRFDPKRVRFVMVGNVVLDLGKVEPFREYVEFTGAVPRSAVKKWMEQFDVFFFPSACEGSAGAVMEAMGSGLPVITTPSSGSRARDGIEGIVRPCEDVDAFEQAIRRFDDDRDLMLKMGQAGRQRVESFDIRAYEAELRRFFGKLLSISGR
jgi:glycosyltransferase involved in cell wall biosynthesis